MENVWEVRQGQGEHGELLADQHEDEGDKANSENCMDRCLHCLSHVPCASLVAWIALLLGLGGVTGGLLIGADRTRDMLENPQILWFMEYTMIGVVSGMFVMGTALLLLGHYSSHPFSRQTFNTCRKNACARGLNIFMLLLSYVLGLSWILASAVLSIPVCMLALLVYLTDYQHFRCIDPKNYGICLLVGFQCIGVDYKEVCDITLERFTNEGRELLICYCVAYFSAVIVAASLIHFLMCMSANITHLGDARFEMVNAYDEPDGIANVKQHDVNDTTM